MAAPPDPFEFVRNLWAQMGVPGFAPAGGMPSGMPSFAPEELERRIAELRQIRQWLEMNLNMLNLQVSGLEMQLAAIKGFKPGADFAAQAMRDAAAYARPDAGMGAAGFPFGAAPTHAADAPPPAPEPAPEPIPAAEAGPGATGAHPWPDPTAWMQDLQSEFVKGMRSLASGAGATPKAAKKAARKTGARKAAPRKATPRKATPRKGAKGA